MINDTQPNRKRPLNPGPSPEDHQRNLPSYPGQTQPPSFTPGHGEYAGEARSASGLNAPPYRPVLDKRSRTSVDLTPRYPSERDAKLDSRGNPPLPHLFGPYSPSAPPYPAYPSSYSQPPSSMSAPGYTFRPSAAPPSTPSPYELPASTRTQLSPLAHSPGFPHPSRYLAQYPSSSNAPGGSSIPMPALGDVTPLSRLQPFQSSQLHNLTGPSPSTLSRSGSSNLPSLPLSGPGSFGAGPSPCNPPPLPPPPPPPSVMGTGMPPRPSAAARTESSSEMQLPPLVPSRAVSVSRRDESGIADPLPDNSGQQLAE